MLRLVLFVGLLVGGCFDAHADNPSEEALSYFDGSRAMVERLRAYDVSFHVESTSTVDDLPIPIRVIDWRVRFDAENEFFGFVYSQRELDINDGIQGHLDNWESQSGLVVTNKGEMVEHMVGLVGVSKRHFRDFATALSTVRFPRIENLGTSVFSQTVMLPTHEVTDLTCAAFDGRSEVNLGLTSYQSENAVRITSVFRDDRMVETHIWLFSSPEIGPLTYETYQQPNGRERLRIYRNEVSYKEIPGYGRVISSFHDSSMIQVRLTQGDREVFKRGEESREVTLNWHEFGSSDDNLNFKLDQVSPMDIDRLLKTKKSQ